MSDITELIRLPALACSKPNQFVMTNNDCAFAVKTFEGSKYFMKKIIPISVFNIFYYRTNIEKDAFDTVTRGKNKFITFRRKTNNIYIRDFHMWIRGVFHAIDAGYLRQMSLIISNNDDKQEIHTFEFKYLEAGSEPRREDKSPLYESVMDLIKNIKDMQNFQKLSGEIDIKVELTYFKETPVSYTTPYFYVIKESFIKNNDWLSNSGYVGKIITGFHTMKYLRYGTEFGTVSKHISDNNISIQEIEYTNQSDNESGKSSISTNCEGINKNKYVVVKCICGIDAMTDAIRSVQCITCLTNCHIACHGYFLTQDIPDNFHCNICVEINDFPKTDSYYFKRDKIVQKTVCSLRLLIVYCFFTQKAPLELIKDHPQNETLVELLKKLKIISEDSLRYQPGLQKYENKLIKRIFIDDVTSNKNASEEYMKLLNSSIKPIGILSSPSTTHEDEVKMCICRIKVSDSILYSRLCVKCNNFYHIACHGFFSLEDLTRAFVCNICTESGNLEKADHIYFNIKNKSERKKCAILRLLIVYCCTKQKLPVHILNHLSNETEKYCKERLIEYSVLDINLNYIPVFANDKTKKKLLFLEPSKVLCGIKCNDINEQNKPRKRQRKV